MPVRFLQPLSRKVWRRKLSRSHSFVDSLKMLINANGISPSV
jgi:hypothetical protein